MGKLITKPAADFVRDIVGWKGFAKLYKVEPLVDYYEDQQTDHVIVSAAVVMYSGPKTYIFPADADGECLDFGELPGSYRGGLDHQEAIDGLLDYLGNR